MKNIFGLSIPQTLEELCDPQRVALLVYDMQVGILNQIQNPEQITLQVLKVLSAARHAGVRVLFSRHLSLPKELMGMSQFRMAMAWQRTDSPEQVKPWFLRDDPSFQIIPELAPRPTEGVFDKLTMSAFEGTWLDFALRDCGINAFIIVGVATEIGIEPTVVSYLFTGISGYTHLGFNATASGTNTNLLFRVVSGVGTGSIDDVSVNPAGVGVPDGGLTVSLLGCALLGLAAVRRRLSY
jgi:biuret amidohydrolase